ncbi:DegT/DnrJ/EryC1/StrS family aminotransferase [Patescibacteria group bacterium]
MKQFIPLANPQFGPTEKKLVKDCMDTSWISSIGKYVEEFAQKLGKFINAKYVLPVSNGTAALHLALIALDIKAGDEVIVPALSFVASANTVTYVGAKPVFVDIEPDTFNLDISQLESKITPKTKAIMTVDLYGHPVDFNTINKIAKKHNLKVISDSAESLGSLYKGKPTGSQADISTFSFFGNKIITTGEGGVVATNNKKYYDTCKLYRDQGKDTTFHNYYHPVIGFNYGLTNLQAAVGIGQLKQIKELVEQKRKIVDTYKKFLKNIAGISFQQEADYAKSNWWMFSILVNKKKFGMDRDQLMKYLFTKNIETRPFFYPLPALPPYKKQNNMSDFSVTQKIADQGMNLPTFATLTQSQIKYICDAIKSAAS